MFVIEVCVLGFGVVVLALLSSQAIHVCEMPQKGFIV